MSTILAQPPAALHPKCATSLVDETPTTGAVSKVDTPPACTVQQQVEQLLEQLGQLKKASQQLETHTNTKINALLGLAKPKQQHLAEQMLCITQQLQVLVAQKPHWFKSRRSVRFFYGRLGYRHSSTIQPAKGKLAHDVVLALEDRGEHKAVVTQKKVNLQHLRSWGWERLQRVGMVRLHKERFWVETL